MKCPHCNFITGQKKRAFLHILSEHYELRTPKCPFCDFVPRNMDDVMTHANNNHKEKSLKDLIEVELKKFKHYDLNQVFYVCPLDGTPSRSKHWLKAHMANKHNIGVDKHFPDKYIKKAKKALNQVWYFCFICDWKSRSHFNTKDHLINHIIQKHAFKP